MDINSSVAVTFCTFKLYFIHDTKSDIDQANEGFEDYFAKGIDLEFFKCAYRLNKLHGGKLYWEGEEVEFIEPITSMKSEVLWNETYFTIKSLLIPN